MQERKAGVPAMVGVVPGFLTSCIPKRFGWDLALLDTKDLTQLSEIQV